MEQDTEYMKLPLEERCAHKVLTMFKIFVLFAILQADCIFINHNYCNERVTNL